MIENVKNGYTLHIYKEKLELSIAVFKFIESQIIHTLKKKNIEVYSEILSKLGLRK